MMGEENCNQHQKWALLLIRVVCRTSENQKLESRKTTPAPSASEQHVLHVNMWECSHSKAHAVSIFISHANNELTKSHTHTHSEGITCHTLCTARNGVSWEKLNVLFWWSLLLSCSPRNCNTHPNVSHLTSVLLPKSCCGKTWDKNNLKFWAFSFHSLPHFLCFQPQSSPNLSAFRCFSDQLRVQAPWGFSPPLVSFFLLFFLCF